jgi:hypothetical protein
MSPLAFNPLRRTAIAVVDALGLGDKLRRLITVKRIPPSSAPDGIGAGPVA